MITLVLVKNPFSPQDGREVERIEYTGTLRELLAAHPVENTALQATVNGFSVAEETCIKDGDFVVIYPVVEKGGKGGGKSILALVASVALSVVAFGAGGLAVGGYMAAAAIMFAGSMLVNRFMGQKADMGDYGTESSDPTYSWSGIQTMEGQNNAIPLTYGKIKSGGQTIGKYIDSDADKEYLNWLVAAGEGEIAFSDIKINNNDIGNFKGAYYETRPGTNDQPTISNFNDTFFTKNIGYSLNDMAWHQDRVQGNASQGFIVTIEFPNGLYHVQDNGALDYAKVVLNIEYKKTTDPVWKNLTTTVIADAKSSAIRKSFRADYLDPGEYDVRVRLVSRQYDIHDNRAAVSCVWTSVTGIVYDDFAYPGVALLGIRALATEQLNGAPSLSFLKERASVWVWDGSTYVQRPANNPAWAAYDFIHQARLLRNINTGGYEIEVRGAKKELMRYEDFAAWAEWCQQRGFYINIEIVNSGELLDMVNKNIANVGHGLVVRFGTKYGCIYDHVQEPVMMFGMGNIVAGTFQEKFLEVNDRANCVEVTYTDANRNYERNVLTVYGETYDTDGYQKTAQLTMNGITSYEQAYREGVYQLECNKRQLRIVTFDAGIDAIACTVGDVVLVAHDVPRWACSGRIFEVVGDRMILPVEISDLTQKYRIQYRTVQDKLYVYPVTVISSENGWTEVQIDVAINNDDPAQAGDVFDLAVSAIGSKPFVVRGITRSSDFIRTLTCIEYDKNLFSEDYAIPPVEYASHKYRDVQDVYGLQGQQKAYTDANGIRRGFLEASWHRPQSSGAFSILLSQDNETWSLLKSGVTDTYFKCDVLPDTTYYIKVITILGMQISRGISYGPIYPDVDRLPPDVQKFDVEKMASGMRRYWWDFEYPEPNDIAGFKIKYIQSKRLIWENGIFAHKGLIVSQPWETQTIRQGAHAVMIKAVDNAGNESKNFAYCLLDIGDLTEENVLFRKKFHDNFLSDVRHNGVITDDGALTSVDTNNRWSTPTDAFWSGNFESAWDGRFSKLIAKMEFLAPATGNFWLKSKIIGPAMIYYHKSYASNEWHFQKNYKWSMPNASRWIMNEDINKPWSDKVQVKAGERVCIQVIGLNADNKKTIIKEITAYIDVPDQEEHFENVQIAKTGTTLPIKTPYYYTTAVRLDAVQNSNAVMVKYLSRTPCQIQLLDREGKPTTGQVDVTWQGFRKEILTDGD